MAGINAWLVGGVLFLMSLVVGVGAQPLFAFVAGGRLLATLAFSAALVIFALGIRGSGTITLCALAVWTVVAKAILQLVSVGLTFGLVDMLIQFVLAGVAVVPIGRAGVMPRPWAWAPGWVLGVVTVLWLLE